MTTKLRLLEHGFRSTEASIQTILKHAGVLRNARQLKGARIKPVYRYTKRCEHCNEEFKQMFARHVFCDACAPEGKFSKYIRKYGISKREFDVMLLIQKGGCAICRKALDLAKDTHVDHDHVSGRVRGLLCNHCNTRVGILEDHEFMKNVKPYLDACNDYRSMGTVNTK